MLGLTIYLWAAMRATAEGYFDKKFDDYVDTPTKWLCQYWVSVLLPAVFFKACLLRSQPRTKMPTDRYRLMYKTVCAIQFVLSSITLLMEFSFYDSNPLVYFIYKNESTWWFTCYLLVQLYLILLGLAFITQVFTFFDWLGCASDSAQIFDQFKFIAHTDCAICLMQF